MQIYANNGKPLISYSVEAAVESKAFDEIYINSDAEIFNEVKFRFSTLAARLRELAYLNRGLRIDLIDKRSDKTWIRYRIELIGKKKLKKFQEEIGFRNPRHLTKIEIWKFLLNQPIKLSIPSIIVIYWYNKVNYLSKQRSYELFKMIIINK